MMAIVPAFVGGLLIGVAATVLLVTNGRVAGISGIVAGLVARETATMLVNAAFVVGLVFGPLIYRIGFGAWPHVAVEGSLPLIAVAGILVGFGARLGSGCTSGHGVVGLARLSPRSIAAVITFTTTAIATVFLMRTGDVP